MGRRITFPSERRDLEIAGVPANLRNGGLKNERGPTTVLAAASQDSPDRMTYALGTTGDPLEYAQRAREIVRAADSSIPLTNMVTRAAETDRTISPEITIA